jgi:hypothetical protein
MEGIVNLSHAVTGATENILKVKFIVSAMVHHSKWQVITYEIQRNGQCKQETEVVIEN